MNIFNVASLALETTIGSADSKAMLT